MAPRHEGYLALVLHAHLPFVRHPEHPVFLEENWFFEALAECYLPLLDRLRRMLNDGVPYRLAMSFSPPLCEMLTDPLLQERFALRLAALTELAEREVVRLRHEPDFRRTAEMYAARFARARTLYEQELGRDVIGAFRALQEAGRLEVLATSATHALLPLLASPRARRAQIRLGVRNCQKHFRRQPQGFWLPECAYVPGLDQELAAEGIRYFLLDSHGLLFASPRPKYGPFAPVHCRSRVAACARDIESSKQVWSAQTGYPGDPAYREFYRDLGWDGDLEILKPLLHPDGIRHDIGIKYYRVTGRTALADKQPYDPAAAWRKADEHAGHFLAARCEQATRVHAAIGRRPFLLAPYDAELFGHWWFEGPDFLELFLRKAACDQRTVRLLTPGEYLGEHPNLQVVEPSASSWGDKGYFEVWLNGGNDWIYPLLHDAEERMLALVDARHDAQGPIVRALDQAARELLLAQSSDWAFILTTGTMVQYAERRIREHLARFDELERMIRAEAIDVARVAALEAQDLCFPEMDFRIFG